jgi:two-component system nitrate/nitrite response regulator NarL
VTAPHGNRREPHQRDSTRSAQPLGRQAHERAHTPLAPDADPSLDGHELANAAGGLSVVWKVDLNQPLEGPPATVLIADRQPMYREMVALAIRERPRIELVGEASDSRTALRLLREVKPNAGLLDVRLPDAGGLEVLKTAVAEGLETRILFLTADETQLTVYNALVAGAAGFLSKNDDEEEICAALEVVACGGALLSPRVHGALLDELRLRGASPLLDERDRDILRLLANGRTTREVGRDMHLAEKTVKSVLSRTIYKKLGVRGATSAVAEALRQGWIQ